MISSPPVAVLALLLASLANLSQAAEDQTPLPVIISTDTATGLSGGWRSGVADIDDGLAIAMALASPHLDVRGIVVTFGNALMEPSYRVAKRVVDGTGSATPVLRGASRPLPQFPMSLYDGSNLHSACLNPGVQFMAEELQSAQAPVTVLAIGPLTDLACLAMNFPDAAEQIKQMVVIGGRNPHEPFSIAGVHLDDFNLALDIPAVRYLLTETRVPIRFMPFGLTSSALIPAAERAVLCQSTQPLAAEFFCPAIVPWLKEWQKTFGEDGFHPWDQNAVHVVTHPEDFVCDPASYTIVACSTGECAGNDQSNPRSALIETDQVWLSPDADNMRIGMCGSYAPDGGKARFMNAVFAFARGGPR